MLKAIEKIDRFLDAYKKLCLEEGIYIDSDDPGRLTFIDPTYMEEFEDEVDMIRNTSIEAAQYNKQWKALDNDKG